MDPHETEIIITVTTDDYPAETSWFLIDQNGSGWTNIPLTQANTTYTWNLCVPDTNCYTFTMFIDFSLQSSIFNLVKFSFKICCKVVLASPSKLISFG